MVRRHMGGNGSKVPCPLWLLGHWTTILGQPDHRTTCGKRQRLSSAGLRQETKAKLCTPAPKRQFQSVKSPQSQPSAPATQALKQRVLELVQVQRSLQQCNDERGRDVETAVADLEQLTSERDKWEQVGKQVQREREQLTLERDQLTRELGELRLERDQVTLERNQLHKQRNKLRLERDQLTLDNNNLTTNHQQLSKRYESLKQDYDSLSQQLSQATPADAGNKKEAELQASLEQLLTEKQQLTENYRIITEEYEELKTDLQQIEHEYEETKQALVHVFPREAYRAKRPDLKAIVDDEKLLEHFIFYGIHEDTNLEYSSLSDAMLAKTNEINETLSIKLQALEALASDSSKRLLMIHDLFVRLSLEGQSK